MVTPADYGGDVHAALAAAQSSHSVLYLPAGTYELGSTPLTLSSAVEIRGAGEATRLNFSGQAAIVGAFGSDGGAGTRISNLQLRGTNASEQSGIVLGTNGNGVQRAEIEQVYIEAVSAGRGIYAELALGLRISACRIGSCHEAIVINGACGCVVERCFADYWAEHGIWICSEDDALGNRANRVNGNVVHGNGGSLLGESERVAVRLSRVGSTIVEGNYVERVLSSAGALGYGIWVDGADLTQSNAVCRNYFGPGTTGDLIRITGLASHTTVTGNSIPAEETICDDGLYTQFHMQQLSDIEQLTGSSTTRRGWVSLADGPVQLHT
jgi:hypothetical protein